MAKGAGMIHPRLATMLVVITTDYPLAEGEPESFLRRCRRAQLQPDLGRRRLLDERRGRPARERRERRRARRRGVRGRARRGVRRPRAPGRRRRRGRDRRARDRRHRRRHDRGGGGDRLPDRDLAARQDRGLRPRPELGPRADGRRLGAVRRRLRAARHRAADRLLRRRRGVRRRVRRRAPCRSSSGAVCRIDLELGLGDGAAGYLASDLTYDYVRINAEYTT